MRKEIDREALDCFAMEQLTGVGQYLHFHGCLEIYCVEAGQAAITVSGQSRRLVKGQMAIVDRYENHSCEIPEGSRVVVISLGTHYTQLIRREYPNQKLPRWLTDSPFNQELYAQIKDSFDPTHPLSELKRIGLVCQWFSRVIEYYGLTNKPEGSDADLDLVAQMMQYIYTHYSERITLEKLSGIFHLSPTAISKKLKERLGTDFRVFVNVIRAQKAAQILDDPENRKTINEVAMDCGFCSMSTFYRSYKRSFSFRKINME